MTYETPQETVPAKGSGKVIVWGSIILAIGMIVASALYNAKENIRLEDDVSQAVVPTDTQGVALPVRWGNLGAELVRTGVIDRAKLDALYMNRGGLDEMNERLLSDTENKQLIINDQNAGFMLNLLWALGLGNKNEILEAGPMSDPRYGGAGRFASTGGWTLAIGNTMDHFSRHPFISLTAEQQALVERVSENIYRPCCNNATHFPDCNHGMAMLGLLELMASQGVSEADMYDAALAVNRYWFPDTYQAIDQYVLMQGMNPRAVPSSVILGEKYSSGAGYRDILSKLAPREQQSGSGCSI